MGRNYLTFLIGLVLLLVFSLAFAYVGIYQEVLVAAIAAIVGFVATLIMALVIGISSRDEAGALSNWFYVVAGVTGLILVWFLTRGGVVLGIW